MRPPIVNKRGSLQLSIAFDYINALIFLFEITDPSTFNLEYSHTIGLYKLSKSSIL